MSSLMENTTETAIVRLEKFTAVQIFEPGVIDPVLDQIEAEAKREASKLDISTELGRKAIASLAYKVARSKTFIESQRKALVSDEKKRLARIDAEGKRIWERLESLQEGVRKPLTDWENSDKERIAAHDQELKEIELSGPYSLQNWQSLTAEAMRDRLSEIENESRNWEEFYQKAAGIKALAVHQIKEAIAKREKYDAEQAELIRLRKESEENARREREERIAREAREKAEREAREREERVRREAELAQARAEAERKAAEARAEAAERTRVEAEQRAVREAKSAAEKAEREKAEAVQAERRRFEAEEQRKRDEQERLERNRKHRAKIHAEAHAAILNHTNFTAEQASEIVKAVAGGLVPHISITY